MKLEEYINQTVSGLGKDPELQLDIKAEIQSHLEDAMDEFKNEGMTEEESEKAALEHMGPVSEVASDIMAGNGKRLKTRGRIALLLQYLLVPAALLVALYFLMPVNILKHQTKSVVKEFWLWGDSRNTSPITFLAGTSALSDKEYTAQQQLVLNGLPSSTEGRGAYNLWKSTPENKVYIGNYLIQLFLQPSFTNDKSLENYEELKRIVEPLRKFDPDNGSFDFLLASKLINAATIKQAEVKYDKNRVEKEYIPGEYDPELLALSMQHLLAATRKKYINFYQADMMREIMTLLGEPESFTEGIQRTAISTSVLLPHIRFYRSLARASLFYGEQQLEKGNTKVGMEAFGYSKVLSENLYEHSWTLIELLVGGAVAAVGERSVEILKKYGFTKEAQQVKTELAGLVKPVKDWKEDKKNRPNLDIDLRKHGSVLDQMLLPALYLPDKPLTKDDLKDSRDLEYVLADRMLGYVISLFFAVMIVATVALALINKLTQKNKVTPLLIIPDLKHIGRIMLLGVLLPVLVHVLIFVHGPSGGREYGLTYSIFYVINQWLLLFVSVIVVTLFLSTKRIRKRCRELEIPVPNIPGWQKNLTKVFLLLLVIPLVLTLVPLENIPRITSSFKAFIPSIIIIPVIAMIPSTLILLVIIAMIITWPSKFFTTKEYSLYYTSLNRSIIPIFAVILLTLNILVFPYLKIKEKRVMLTISEKMDIAGEYPAFFSVQEKEIIRYLKKQYQDSK